MIVRDRCPQCHSQHYKKKNGHIHNGKQNHRCKRCDRQFVLEPDNRLVTDADRALVERLLRERLSLRGICRTVGVSLTWLLDFVVGCYEVAPEHLNVQLPEQADNVVLQRLGLYNWIDALRDACRVYHQAASLSTNRRGTVCSRTQMLWQRLQTSTLKAVSA